MKLLDLFSGIGGFSLAASWAGIETAAFCEREKFCQKVLKNHWPQVPIVDDIFKMRGDKFGAIDIVSGGFPCQPFSVAGKRAGQEDDRYLWPEMFRIISEARPAWVVGENVPGIIDMALDQVLFDLEGIGYETQTVIIPACAVDAQHRRDRVWILGYSEHAGHASTEERGSTEKRKDTSTTRKIKTSESSGSSLKHENVGHAERSGLQDGNAGKDRQPTYIKSSGTNSGHTRGKRPTQSRLGNLVDGLPTGLDGYWPAEPPDIPRTSKGIPNRVNRLKALGNSIVPQVAFQIFRAIVELDEQAR